MKRPWMMGGVDAIVGPNTGLNFTQENAQQFAATVWNHTNTPGVSVDAGNTTLRVDVHNGGDVVCDFSILGGANLRCIEFNAPDFCALFDLSFSNINDNVRIIFNDGNRSYSVRHGDLRQLIIRRKNTEQVARDIASDIGSF